MSVRARVGLFFVAGLCLMPLAAPLHAQGEDGSEETDILPGIEPGREVITIESGKFKLETDLLNREMESVLEKQRPEWREKPAVLTSDDRVSRSLRREYRRKRKELEKKFSSEEEEADRAGPDDHTPPPGLLDLEGLARTQPRVYSKEPLSIKERMERAQKEEALLNQALRELGSREGRLRLRVQREPLKGYQKNLEEMSAQIEDIKKELGRTAGDPGPLWRSLGKAYLKSQHYLETLDAGDRLLLIRNAEFSDTTLGSYELAAWALKQAVARLPNDRELHLLLSDTYEKLRDEATALMHAKYAEGLADGKRR